MFVGPAGDRRVGDVSDRDGLKYGEHFKNFMKLRCLDITAEGMLRRLEGPNADEIPRFYGVKFGDGNTLALCRRDLPRELHDILLKLPIDEAFNNPSLIKELLGLQPIVPPCDRVEWEQSYFFPSAFIAEPAKGISRLDDELTAFGVVVNGLAVSRCYSVRENALAAEGRIETIPEFQHMGMAAKVAKAWASDLCQNGKTPFFRHPKGESASESLLRSLGNVLFMEDVGYY